MGFLNWKDWVGGALNVFKETPASDIGEGLIRHEWQGDKYNVQQTGTTLKAYIMNNLQMGLDFLVDSNHTVVNSEDHYNVTIDGLKTTTSNPDGYELAENLHFSIKTTEGNLKGISKLIINGDTYELKKVENGTIVELSVGDLEEDKIYQIYYDGASFIVNFSTLKATETKAGTVTLKQLDALGVTPRDELPKPAGAVYTYNEMLAIPDGQYNINTQTVFSYLGLGSSFMNTGVLFKKTYTVNGIKRVNLNYINSAMDTGITGMSMFFIDVSSENAKNLHTSTTNSGLWQIEQSWGKFDLSEPGYFKMGNGLTFQWFFAQTLASNGDAGTLISYPIAFDNTALTLQGTDGGSGAHTIGANIVDRFRCRVWGRFPSTGELINSTIRVFAIGY